MDPATSYGRRTFSLTAGFWISFLFVTLSPQTSAAKSSRTCVSSCGKIPKITHPFRLRSDPEHCGDRKFELDCINNVAVLQLTNSAQYNVEEIDYDYYTIRLADPNIQAANCSSMPRYFLHESNFTDIDDESSSPFGIEDSTNEEIIYLTCENSVREYDGCLHDPNTYAIVGSISDLTLWKPGCRLTLVSLVSLSMASNYSYGDIHAALVYGFELQWWRYLCDCGSKYCYSDRELGNISCFSELQNTTTWVSAPPPFDMHAGTDEFITNGSRDAKLIKIGVVIGQYGLASFVGARFLFGATLLTVLFLYKWHRRHLSMYENVEVFLQDNNLMPIRYSYLEIGKMAKGFKIKLGEGGFGSVYKGQLRSGPYVAIKMLSESKGNGQDFISEVATIGRIHHVNVVRLIGFCVEGSKRALVYEFMHNGSLDKYIFCNDESVHISYEKIYQISMGVACGLAYLHQGCDMQILHFDIKPHNILLDENFLPKVSDFGLARLYPIDCSIVQGTLKGTPGYIAPELYYKNSGGVSYKADVYSFGMLLMEMANRRRNQNLNAKNSNESFIPTWIFDQLRQGKEMEMDDCTEEEKKLIKKMILVALWCIQFKPKDRPPMNRVVKMLEGEVEGLELPPQLSLYPPQIIREDHQTNSDYNKSSDSIPSSNYIEESAIGLSMKNIGCQKHEI